MSAQSCSHPPTYYSLTALGKELFADPDIIDVDKQQMPQTMPYEQLQAAVLQEAEAQEQELLFLTEVVPDVLSLKISQSGDADLWKIIEVGQDMDVNVLCRDLCRRVCAGGYGRLSPLRPRSKRLPSGIFREWLQAFLK